SGEEVGRQGAMDWERATEILMELGIVELDPDLLFEEPPPFMASYEWRSGAFVAAIKEIGAGFPSPRAARHLAEIAEKFEALRRVAVGAYQDEPPPALRAVQEALAAVGELSGYAPNLVEDAWLLEEVLAELERLSARKKNLAGELSPQIELARRTLLNDMSHEELHSILSEIVLASPERLFNVFREDLLQGYFWGHEKDRFEELLSRSKEIVLVNSSAFPAFGRAWEGFKILSKRQGEPGSEAAFVRFLMVDAGLDFDEMSLLVSAEGLAWAERRHSLLSRGDKNERFELAGELISGLVDEVGGAGHSGGTFGDTVEAGPSPDGTASRLGDDDSLLKMKAKGSGGSAAGKTQAASINPAVGAAQGTPKSLK
nr:hypothetical protein [bacterium]